jgi:DNA-binding IclR family transcriptional regulator
MAVTRAKPQSVPSTIAPVAEPRRVRVSGIDRVLQILDHLQTTGVPATAYELAKAIGAPLSTVYALVDDLVDKGMLDRTGEGVVWLGARLYHYGLSYARNLDVLTVATHEMYELSHAVGETVQICGRDGHHMVVLAMVEGDGHFQVTSRVGTRVPLNWTASGRLLVGHLSDAERRALFRACAKASPTGRAETDEKILADTSRHCFAEGLSIQAGESDYSVACIAAPIRDHRGACLATISIVVPEFKVAQPEPDLVAAVKASARRIEERLGRPAAAP